MMSLTVYQFFRLVFGTLYPAYASYKAVKTRNSKEYVKWMMYWIVFALFTCIETFADIFISWIPFYYELKIVFVLWLLSPATKGASILYRKFIHPQLMKREKEIDTYIAKASDQGYTAFLSLGSKGINMATNFMLTTAMKGQSKIADHLRKSYSLNDLSDDKADGAYRQDSLDLTDDEDAVDNRNIEESYAEEMHEPMREPPVRRKKAARAKDTDTLHEIAEAEEESRSSSSSRRSKSSYSHKDVSHYGTLPRSKARPSTRTSVRKVDYQE